MTSQSGPPTRAEVFPKFQSITDDVLFGDVWERPGLSKRDRSIATCAMLAALYRTDQLRGHVNRALDNGVTRDELVELFTHVPFYAGWPTGVNAMDVAMQVFGQRGLL